MSMWELEAFAEGLVRAVGRSERPVRERRELFATAYELVGNFDVSFIHFRTRDILVDGQFFHRIDATDHPDPSRREAIDALIAAGRRDWLMGDGRGEAFYTPDPPSLWFDATMPLWKPCVEAGRLTGAAAEPVEPLPAREALVRFFDLLIAEPEPDAQLIKMLHGFGAYVSEVLDPSDPELQRIQAHPELQRALAAEHEDWVAERFDARGPLPYLGEEEGVGLRWWCEPLG